MTVLAFTIIHATRAIERDENVQSLLGALPNAIVLDDVMGGIAVRNQSRGCWPVARRAWMRDVKDATHHLVLEDDALLCDRFADLALEAVTREPRAAIFFFYGWRLTSVATSFPVEFIPQWLEWTRTQDHPHHSTLQLKGARALGVPMLFTSPSLVDHAKFPSLLGHGDVTADNFEQSPKSFELEPR